MSRTAISPMTGLLSAILSPIRSSSARPVDPVERQMAAYRRANAWRRAFGRPAHEPFVFEGKPYGGNRFMVVLDGSDAPPNGFPAAQWVQDKTVRPR